MPKLYFHYGAMAAGKSIALLTAAYEYEQQDKKVIVVKPAIDTRNGTATIWSRVPGLTREADIVIPHQQRFTTEEMQRMQQVDLVLCDEAQFMHPAQIEQLSYLACFHTPVICYGLRADFRGQLFSGSKALLTWADDITEIKNICRFCHKKATFNFKLGEDHDVHQIKLGAEDAYVGVCKKCFYLKRGPQDRMLGNYQIYQYSEMDI